MIMNKDFILCRGYDYKHRISHGSQIRNNNSWVTQRVAPCRNLTRLYGSQLPRNRANRARQAPALHGCNDDILCMYINLSLESLYKPPKNSLRSFKDLRIQRDRKSNFVLYYVVYRYRHSTDTYQKKFNIEKLV
uniref:SFRICE_031078 n=1 Tax=Spodoptera frugiperda TaxID=7108 RepID=A0A2H1VPV1_SPOFR